MEILVIDVGGTHVKMLASGQEKPRKFDSGPKLTPDQMVQGVLRDTNDWKYDAVSIGYPAPVRRGKPLSDPMNLGPGWVGFDFETVFGRPIKLINDAAMQALGSYVGDKMLFLGLGTGLGSAIVFEGGVEPLELAHLPYRKGTFEDYVGVGGLERFGLKKWRRRVAEVVELLSNAVQVDYVVLGGGNVRKLKELPPNCRAGANANAFLGGFKLWEKTMPIAPSKTPAIAS